MLTCKRKNEINKKAIKSQEDTEELDQTRYILIADSCTKPESIAKEESTDAVDLYIHLE